MIHMIKSRNELTSQIKTRISTHFHWNKVNKKKHLNPNLHVIIPDLHKNELKRLEMRILFEVCMSVM